jgi:hypothetical protein
MLLWILIVALVGLTWGKHYISLTDKKRGSFDLAKACYNKENKLEKSKVRSKHLGIIARMMEKRDIYTLWIHSIDNFKYENYRLAIDLIDKDFAENIYEDHPIKFKKRTIEFDEDDHCTRRGYCAIVKKVPNKSADRQVKYPLCMDENHDHRINDFEENTGHPKY